MKRNTALTMFFAYILLANLTATAGDDFTCSPANVAGTWGYIETATFIDAGIAYPYASVGIYTLDAHGNISGKRTASAAGSPVKAAIVGTATVNPDCTGIENLSFYDESGNLIGTAIKALVYVNKGREVNKLITATAGPIVAITKAKRILPGRQDLLGLDRKDNGRRAFGCSNADLEGEWGTTMTGMTLPSPTTSRVFGSVNKAVYDSEGNFGGTQIRSIHGAVGTFNFIGEYIVNPDCTGTKIGKTYLSGTLQNTAYQDFVLVDDGNEIFEIITSNILANGTSVPTIITGQSQKTFPKGAQALD